MDVKTKIKGIELAWYVVNDLDTAIKYYTDVIGLTLEEKQEEFGWAELSGESGARLGLAQTQPGVEIPSGANAVITISVEELDQFLEDLKEQGATLLGEVMEIPGQVKMQMVRDPDGNYFQLVEKW
jgi:predicted enzyme related to lactoylglutathione lyase